MNILRCYYDVNTVIKWLETSFLQSRRSLFGSAWYSERFLESKRFHLFVAQSEHHNDPQLALEKYAEAYAERDEMLHRNYDAFVQMISLGIGIGI